MFAVCLAGNHIKGFARARFSSSSCIIICADCCLVFIYVDAGENTTCWVCYVLHANACVCMQNFYVLTLKSRCKSNSQCVFIVSLCGLIWCYIPIDLGKLVSMGTDSNSRWCVLECVPCGHNLCVRIPVFSFLFPAFSTEMSETKGTERVVNNLTFVCLSVCLCVCKSVRCIERLDCCCMPCPVLTCKLNALTQQGMRRQRKKRREK